MKHTAIVALILGICLLCSVDAQKLTFRFAHAIPDAGPVDVQVGGKTIFPAVKFGTVTTSVPLPSTDSLEVTVSTAITKTVLLQDTFIFTQPLTVAATGTLNDPANPADLFGYLDFPNVTPGKGDAAVRAINLIVNSPELNVDSTKVIKGTTQLLTETVAFPAATNYELIPASIYNLVIATTDNVNLIYKPGTAFGSKNFYTIFLFGDYSNTGDASKAAVDAARQGNYATVGTVRNLFLNVVNDDKQLLPVNVNEEL